MTLDDQEKGEDQNGAKLTSAGTAGGGEAPASKVKDLFNKVVWHGGSVADACLNAASAQVKHFSFLFPY